MAQENETGFDTSDDFHADTDVAGAGGVGDGVDFEKSLPRPVSDIQDDISTPREDDDTEDDRENY